MTRRNSWRVVGAGVVAFFGVLVAGAAGYWQYANQLPVYPTPSATMPVPNAYADYVAAGQMCEAAGGAAVAPSRRTGPAGSGGPGFGPAAGGSRQPEAFEPGVPLDQVRAVVARNRKALARLRQGFHKQYRCPLLAQTWPELTTYRELARVLLTQGKLAEREGRWDDGARSYLDGLRLGTDIPRGGPLIHGLVAIAVESIALKPLDEAADRLGGPAAASAAREMVRLEAHAPSLADTLTNEKAFMTAQALQMFRQAGGWRQLTGAPGSSPSIDEIWLVLRLRFTPKRRMLDNLRSYMNALIARSQRPYYSQGTPPPVPGDPLSQMELPVFDQAGFLWAVRDAHWRITEARLAVRAYQQEHGASPPSLAALVPAYLPAAPQDPFAPKPLVYRRTRTGALIYSRGPDGKDDGGRDLGTRVAPDSRGDIVSMRPPNQH